MFFFAVSVVGFAQWDCIDLAGLGRVSLNFVGFPLFVTTPLRLSLALKKSPDVNAERFFVMSLSVFPNGETFIFSLFTII